MAGNADRADNDSTKMISGPVNVMRLSGKPFGIDKVLYVYFDLHMPLGSETRCNDVLADDIVRYLIDEFKNVSPNLTIDFFLETFPTSIKARHNWRDMYIRELRQLVAQSFEYDKEKNKVMPSKIFPNVRLHYMTFEITCSMLFYSSNVPTW